MMTLVHMELDRALYKYLFNIVPRIYQTVDDSPLNFNTMKLYSNLQLKVKLQATYLSKGVHHNLEVSALGCQSRC